MSGANILYQGINVASLICSSLVIIIILTIMSINKVLADRVSLRFTLGTSVFDCLRAIVILFILRKTGDSAWCAFLSFSSHWFTLMYLFLTCSIALNLQLVILKGLRFQPRWELYYWVSSFSAATILLLAPLGKSVSLFSKCWLGNFVFLHRFCSEEYSISFANTRSASGMLGINKFSGYCEFVESGALQTFSWRMLCFLLWVILACIYCTVIVIKVVIHLRQKISVLNKEDAALSMSIGAEECSKIMCNLKRLIRRM